MLLLTFDTQFSERELTVGGKKGPKVKRTNGAKKGRQMTLQTRKLGCLDFHRASSLCADTAKLDLVSEG